MAHDIAYDSAKNENRGCFAKLLSLDMPLHLCITCNLELYLKEFSIDRSYEVWRDLEPRTVNLLTDNDVRNLIVKDRWFHPNWEFNFETLEFRSLALICLTRVLQVYIWVVDFEIEGRWTGIQGYAVPYDEYPPSTEEIRDPPFRRMWKRVIVDARSG